MQIVEQTGFILFGLLLLTQVLLPSLRNRPLFPQFRRESETDKAIRAARIEAEEIDKKIRLQQLLEEKAVLDEILRLDHEPTNDTNPSDPNKDVN